MNTVLDKTEVISIDHGYGTVKTINCIFNAGVRVILSEPAFFDDVILYNGQFYKVGTAREVVMDNKTVNEDYYILTLASIAKELKLKGLHEAKVLLAVGLPATRYGAEKKDFIDYLSKNEDVTFSFEQEEYKVKIVKVVAFPQGYSAVVDKIPTFSNKEVVVDIGSWTVDIFPIVNKKPDDANANTIPGGIITCMRAINKQCIRLYNETIDEEFIKSYIMTGKTELDDKFVAIMEKELKSFATNLFNSLREEGYSLNTTQFYFVGGGAAVMKNFGGYDQKNIKYNLDVKANAKGYERLAKIALARIGGK